MSTIAPHGPGALRSRHPVIEIDAEERPVSIAPGVHAALGMAPESAPPDTLDGIMDEESARRVGAIIRGDSPVPQSSLPLTLVGPGGVSRTAAAEVLPTAEGGAVLLVSFDAGSWTDRDAARLLDRSRDLVVSVRLRPSLVFRYVNAAAGTVTGYTADELLADPSRFIAAVHPGDRDALAIALADAGRLDAPVIFRFRHRGGEWRWLELSGTPVADSEGTAYAVDAIIRDVTLRHRFEEQFRLLAERSPEMVFRVSLGSVPSMDYVSPACESVTGHAPEEFYADALLLLRVAHPDDRSLLEDCVARPGAWCNRPVRFRIYHPDGSLHAIEQVTVPVRDETDRLTAIEGVCRDVTRQDEVEAALQAMNRRMNLLASLTRHDILNQLTVLLGSLELAGGTASRTELDWFLTRARKAAWAIQGLAEFTRDYQAIGQGIPQWAQVPALVGRVAASFAGGGVRIEVTDEPWEILADPLVELVFYNLIENALRHGGSVGCIRFSVEEETAGGVAIVAEDDGVGVPVGEKERIFERGVGRNTGLGLSLASEILASTGITISETGRQGEGARFEMRVPPGACRLVRIPARDEILLPNS